MSRPNKLKIHINGMRYAITTDLDPGYVAGLGLEIDTIVQAHVKESRASMSDALVLCALSCIDEKKKAEASADHLREQVTGYVEEANHARQEVQELRRELEKLKSRHGGKQGDK